MVCWVLRPHTFDQACGRDCLLHGIHHKVELRTYQTTLNVGKMYSIIHLEFMLNKNHERGTLAEFKGQAIGCAFGQMISDEYLK